MDWMIAALLLVILGGAMPSAIRALKRSASGKRRGGGVFMALMMGFMAVLDPAKADAIEQIDKRKDLGDAETGEGGERID